MALALKVSEAKTCTSEASPKLDDWCTSSEFSYEISSTYGASVVQSK